MATRKHVQVTIDFIERGVEEGHLDWLEKDNSQAPTREEALAYLQELQAEGLRYVPCSCEKQDAQGRCLGWPVIDGSPWES